MDFKKVGVTFAISLVVGLYTAFVVQTFWNWFAVKAFGVPSVTYWEMYGVTMLLGLLFSRDGDSVKNDEQWKTAFMILDACVPPDKREFVADEMKARLDGIWLDMAFMVFGKFINNTVTLVLGWAIYTFLVSN